MKQKILLIFIVLFTLNCTNDNFIKLNGRQYTFYDNFDDSDKIKICGIIDSLLSKKSYQPIGSDNVFISRRDSTVKIQLSYDDTVRYYLSLNYQLFANDIKNALESDKKTEVEITNRDSTYRKLFIPEDTTFLGLNLDYSFGRQYCSLEIHKPISDEQGVKAFRLSKHIMKYILADRDSSSYKIYLHKNEVKVNIPYQADIPIDTGLEGLFHYTANLLSDSLFNNWDTYIELYENDRLVKKFKNNKVNYKIREDGN